MSDRAFDPYDGAIGEALQDAQRMMPAPLPGPPGMVAVPWPQQTVRFLDVLPDLMTGGPKAQEIDAQNGPGSAQAYMLWMFQQIRTGRQRRSR